MSIWRGFCEYITKRQGLCGHAAEAAQAARGGPHGLHLIYSANPPNFGGTEGASPYIAP